MLQLHKGEAFCYLKPYTIIEMSYINHTLPQAITLEHVRVHVVHKVYICGIKSVFGNFLSGLKNVFFACFLPFFKLDTMRKPITHHLIMLLLFIGGMSFPIQANAQCSLAVLANVNAALSGATCTYTPTVAAVLVSQNCPGGSLVVEAYITGVWVTNPTFTYSNVNQNYQYRVRDLVSGNFAVGFIRIQDKTAPVITCGLPVTIYCENSCAALPSPTVNDCDPNCSLTYTESAISFSCASTKLKSINRVFKATDAGGNTATCAWTYHINRRPASSIVFPASLTLSVNGTDCSPWCENAANNPSPSPSGSAAQFAPGVPTINGVPITSTLNPTAGCNGICVPGCSFNVSYSDVVTVLCGSNRRISRTWTVSSACSSTVTYVQTINIYTDGNTSCGQACSPPTNLTHQLPSNTTARFLWTAPSSCVVRYQVQYRFKVGGIWGAWTTTTTTTTNLLVTRPPGAVQGQYTVTTVCNGVSSAVSTTYDFLMNAFQATTERSDEATTLPAVGIDAQLPVIWPNPTQGEVHIDMGKALAEPGLLTILTIDGRLVSTQPLPTGTQQAVVDLSNQPDGFYLFRLQIAQEVMTERVKLVNQ